MANTENKVGASSDAKAKKALELADQADLEGKTQTPKGRNTPSKLSLVEVQQLLDQQEKNLRLKSGGEKKQEEELAKLKKENEELRALALKDSDGDQSSSAEEEIRRLEEKEKLEKEKEEKKEEKQKTPWFRSVTAKMTGWILLVGVFMLAVFSLVNPLLGSAEKTRSSPPAIEEKSVVQADQTETVALRIKLKELEEKLRKKETTPAPPATQTVPASINPVVTSAPVKRKREVGLIYDQLPDTFETLKDGKTHGQYKRSERTLDEFFVEGRCKFLKLGDTGYGALIINRGEGIGTTPKVDPSDLASLELSNSVYDGIKAQIKSGFEVVLLSFEQLTGQAPMPDGKVVKLFSPDEVTSLSGGDRNVFIKYKR